MLEWGRGVRRIRTLDSHVRWNRRGDRCSSRSGDRSIQWRHALRHLSDTVTALFPGGSVSRTAPAAQCRRARHWEYAASYDGKDNPVIGNSLNGDMIARTRINATTVKTVNKQDGKITTTGTNALGQTVNNVTVWNKQ
jgi:hypothetical protein